VTEREELERQVRELLTADLDYITLTNLLFQQETGLFARLGKTEEQRRELVQSELWALAQARRHELEKRDLEHFRKVVQAAQEQHPTRACGYRLEPGGKIVIQDDAA
jgi:hypothetical protein